MGNKGVQQVHDTMTNPNFAVIADLLRDGLVTGHMPYLTISSGSMSPLLQPGDQVGVQKVSLAQLSPGDIVVVYHQDMLLTHRYYGVQPARLGEPAAFFVTRGDRSRGYDPVWREQQLLGRVVVRRRGQHLLWLDYGHGLWLNRRLARLAGVERIIPEMVGASEARQDLPQRIVRLAVYIVAAGLVRTIEYIN